MAEHYSKSKLKRKKSCVEKQNPEVSSRDTVFRGRSALFPGDMTADSGGAAVPAAAWWTGQPPPAVESLWALTLTSALPYLESQHWDLVPDLPQPSTARPTVLKLDDQQWCDLREEVAPFPEPSVLWSTGPVGLVLSERAPLAQSNLAAHTCGGQSSSHSRQSPDGKPASPRYLAKGRRLSLHSREEEASSAGCSRVKGEEGAKGEEEEDEEEEDGPVNRQHLTNQVKVSDSRLPLQEEGRRKEEAVKDKEEEDVQGSVRGGGERLQCCPMCLLVFPAGFTQMDCDGHLAQCLSEMNVDMTW
ncbi:hypothetical protein INR49_000514 [Caranx melampygus]|nr:hypothetical protein INR49_000514 [Caranx melampygus]